MCERRRFSTQVPSPSRRHILILLEVVAIFSIVTINSEDARDIWDVLNLTTVSCTTFKYPNGHLDIQVGKKAGV